MKSSLHCLSVSPAQKYANISSDFMKNFQEAGDRTYAVVCLCEIVYNSSTCLLGFIMGQHDLPTLTCYLDLLLTDVTMRIYPW